jgi:hypothetical protein
MLSTHLVSFHLVSRNENRLAAVVKASRRLVYSGLILSRLDSKKRIDRQPQSTHLVYYRFKECCGITEDSTDTLQIQINCDTLF